MPAPIFKFRNIRRVIDTATARVRIYGVFAPTVSTDKTGLDIGTLPSEVSAVVLTVQCANASNVPVSVTVGIVEGDDGDGTSALGLAHTILVQNYPIPANNAFDPLTGNIVLTEGLRLFVRASAPNAISVTVSVLEIANATAA